MAEPKTDAADEAAADQVTEVLMFLGNRKRLAVMQLFPDCERYYFDEWMDRKPFEFWGHLDRPHRRRLIRLAREFYDNEDGLDR